MVMVSALGEALGWGAPLVAEVAITTEGIVRAIQAPIFGSLEQARKAGSSELYALWARNCGPS